MKELQVGELIEPNYIVDVYIDGKKYSSESIKVDGSYVKVYFGRLNITIPRVYTDSMSTPDENGTYFRIYKA